GSRSYLTPAPATPRAEPRGPRIPADNPTAGVSSTAGLTPRWPPQGHPVGWGPMAARWEGDDRGQGVGDASQLVSGASELVTAFGHPTWVAEQPEIHLLPHVESWCQQDGRLALTGS